MNNKTFNAVLCPNCFLFPSITIPNSMCINLSCQFCKYNEILLIKDYLNIKDIRTCDYYAHNRTISSTCEKYCVHCQKWLCDECDSLHKKDSKMHKVVKRNKDNKTFCKCKGKVDFFCYDCNYHFCKECKREHLTHKFNSLTSIISNEEFKQLNEKINQLDNFINKKLLSIKNEIISSLYQAISLVNNVYQRNYLINSNLLSFLKLLVQSYETTNHNFFVMQNITTIFDFELPHYDKKSDDIKEFLMYLNTSSIIGKEIVRNEEYFQKINSLKISTEILNDSTLISTFQEEYIRKKELETFNLVSKGGYKMKINRKAIKNSSYLTEIVKKYPYREDIVLASIKIPTLDKIIKYLEHYIDITPKKIDKSKKFNQIVDDWEYFFIAGEKEAINDISKAANYLGIPSLVELCDAKIESLNEKKPLNIKFLEE